MAAQRRLLLITGLVLAVLASAGCEHMPWNKKDSDRKIQPPKTASGEKTLYERLGGEKAIRAVIDEFVARGAANPKVNFTRKGHPNQWEATPKNVETLKQRLVEFVASATGGPIEYKGRDMTTSHKGMKITDAEFDALAADLKASLQKFNVPQREQDELMAIVGGTRNAIVGQ